MYSNIEMAKKTWKEKLNSDRPHQVKKTEKRFADIPEGSIMLIATPLIIDDYVRNIPLGKNVDLLTMRNDLANEYNAEKTCPVTTSIFLRIVSEAAYDAYNSGANIENITPFWRMVNPNMKLAQKLSFGTEFIIEQRKKEGIEDLQ